MSITLLSTAIDIVMVNTTLPANIGSTARAMHTMGLSSLVLVNPKYPIDDTSMAHAAGATALLQNAKTVATLEDAIANSQLVFAASSRNRHLPRPIINPSQTAMLIEQFLYQQSAFQLPLMTAQHLTNQHITPKNDSINSTPLAKISILFGREDRGLTNDELALADYHIQIDANPDYPVLNVASAVQVITSFIYAHFANLASLHSYVQDSTQYDTQDNPPTVISKNINSAELLHHIRQHWDEPAISKQQQQHLQNQLIKLFSQLDLANTDDLRSLPNRLNRLLSRVQLDNKEYQLLQSLINTLLKRMSQ